MIEITSSDAIGSRSCEDLKRWLERSIAISKQDAHIIAIDIRDSQVKLAVKIKISNSNGNAA